VVLALDLAVELAVVFVQVLVVLVLLLLEDYLIHLHIQFYRLELFLEIPC
jgi:hypothetical protein